MNEKAKKFFMLLVVFFILSIMVASVLNYSLSFNSGGVQEQQPILTYNGYDFFPTNVGGWLTNKDGRQIALTYNPQQLENIFVNDVDFNSLRFSEKVYLSLDINDANLIASINDIIRNIQLPRTVQSCPEDLVGCENLPLKTCEDSTDSVGVIYLKDDEIEIIQLDNNCLFIQAPSQNITRLVNKIIYKELGII